MASGSVGGLGLSLSAIKSSVTRAATRALRYQRRAVRRGRSWLM